MKKGLVYILVLFILGIVLSGCTNTFRGAQQDTKHNWETMQKWDDNFRFKWW